MLFKFVTKSSLNFCFRIIIYSALDPDRGTELGFAQLPGDILCIQYHCDAVWVGLANGTLAVFRRSLMTLVWDLANVQLIPLGSDPVVCLLPVRASGLYAACGKRVWVVDAYTNEQLKSFIVQPRNCSNNNNNNNGVVGGPASLEADQQLYVHQVTYLSLNYIKSSLAVVSFSGVVGCSKEKS